jgi:putative alpha-1,2-mannosidase
MSAWYIFSSLGFYPVNPQNGAYVFGSPIIDEAIIELDNGKSLEIIAVNNSEKNKFINEVYLNGKKHENSFITHKQIMSGGKLKFVMGPNPNYNFGKLETHRPKSKIY